jgi:rhodanese-related sulfurtransferase
MFTDSYNLKHIYAESLLQFPDKIAKTIDIREAFELDICKVPKTMHIPMRLLLSSFDKLLNKEETYYLLCHTGQRSYVATEYLTERGYNIINIVGGIAAMDQYNVPY